MEQEKYVKEARKVINQIRGLQDKVNLHKEDQRYTDYITIQKKLYDGQLLQESIERTSQMVSKLSSYLGQLREKSPAVNTMLTEMETGVPQSKRRTDEQLSQGHYSNTQQQSKPVEPIPEPKKEVKEEPKLEGTDEDIFGNLDELPDLPELEDDKQD